MKRMFVLKIHTRMLIVTDGQLEGSPKMEWSYFAGTTVYLLGPSSVYMSLVSCNILSEVHIIIWEDFNFCR